MTSLLHNTNRPVHFHVLENRLSEENKRILRDIGKRYPHGQWTFYHVESNENFFIDVDNNSHLTIETYFRLFLPELLTDTNKVLWLDGDTIIDGNIGELFDIDLEEFLVGAVVQDFAISINEIELELEPGTYFNAGVLLCNLSALRDFNLFQKAISTIPLLYERFLKLNISFYADQESLNYLLRGKYKRLPPKFNSIPRGHIENEVYSLEEYAVEMSSPIVIHTGGKQYKRILHPNKLMPFVFNDAIKKVNFYINKTGYAAFYDHTTVTDYFTMRANVFNFLDEYTSLAFFREDFFVETAKTLCSALELAKLAVWGVNKFSHKLVLILLSYGLKVDVIVDGLNENPNLCVWGKNVESPDVLWQSDNHYFVLLAMEKQTVANKIRDILAQHGYAENESYHIYETAYSGQ
jgi:lipopolysaccharide biosynthesis glycosyltransferase